METHQTIRKNMPRVLAYIQERPVTALQVAEATQLSMRITQSTLRRLTNSKRIYRLKMSRVLVNGHWYSLFVAPDSVAAKRDKRGLVYEPDILGPTFNEWLAQA